MKNVIYICTYENKRGTIYWLDAPAVGYKGAFKTKEKLKAFLKPAIAQGIPIIDNEGILRTKNPKKRNVISKAVLEKINDDYIMLSNANHNSMSHEQVVRKLIQKYVGKNGVTEINLRQLTKMDNPAKKGRKMKRNPSHADEGMRAARFESMILETIKTIHKSHRNISNEDIYNFITKRAKGFESKEMQVWLKKVIKAITLKKNPYYHVVKNGEDFIRKRKTKRTLRKYDYVSRGFKNKEQAVKHMDKIALQEPAKRRKTMAKAKKTGKKRPVNLNMIAGAVNSKKTPKHLKAGLLKKYGAALKAKGLI